MSRRRPWLAALALLLLVLSGAALPAGGGSADPAAPATSAGTTASAPAGEKVFTTAALAACDGKDGKAAYVAVDGVVYDVSDSASWPQGQHTRCDLGAMAGRDLSAEIRQAPASMRALLKRMPVVGSLQQ